MIQIRITDIYLDQFDNLNNAKLERAFFKKEEIKRC